MAHLARWLGRNLASHPFLELHRIPIQQNPISPLEKLASPLHFFPSPVQKMFTRNYISEFRKSAFQDNILRLLRNEIQYEMDQIPAIQPTTKFGSFTIDDRPGEQWIRLETKFAESEEIKVEATMFDGAVPVPVSGRPKIVEEMLLFSSVVVSITKDDGDVMEILCSAWPDSLEIKQLFVRRDKNMPAQFYFGPSFKELDDNLQDSLYEFLEVRGIDDEMAVFLHNYMKNKGRNECVRWMDTVRSYIQEK